MNGQMLCHLKVGTMKCQVFLFHACKTCMCKILEITTAGNCNKVRKIMYSTCCFINSQLSAEENCLDKIHFWLNHGMDGMEIPWIMFVRSANVSFAR